MAVNDISEIKKKLYTIEFPVGKVIYYKEFDKIIITKNGIEKFLKKSAGPNWDNETIKDFLLKDGIQRLITWVSTEDDNDIHLKMISLIMSMRYTDFTETNSKIYFQVIDETYDLTEKIENFNDAFKCFRKAVYDFIGNAI